MAGASGIGSYSTNANVNATVDGGTVTWAENQPPSSVNNSVRQNLADIRTSFNDLAWFQYGSGDQATGTSYLGVPYVYSSATSVQIAGADVTAAHHAGRRMKFVGSATGTIYGSIASSSYAPATNTTTINLTWDSGSLANEALTGYLSQIPVTGHPLPSGAATPPLVFNTTLDYAPTNIIDVTQNINDAARFLLTNPNAGAAASASLSLSNGPSQVGVAIFGTGFTTSGISRADGGRVSSNGTGGLTVGTFSNSPTYLAAGGVEIARCDPGGNFAIGGYPSAYMLHLERTTWPTIGMSKAGIGNWIFKASDSDNHFAIAMNASDMLTIASSGSGAGFFCQPQANIALRVQDPIANDAGFEVTRATATAMQITSVNRAASVYTDLTIVGKRVMLYSTDFGATLMTLDSPNGSVGVGISGGGWSGNARFSSQCAGALWSGSIYTSGTAGAVLVRVDNTTASLQAFYYGGSGVGTITTNGTTTTYGTTSDLRLKDNIKPADDPGDIIDAIEVDQFDWISDKSHTGFGIVAQKLHKIFPDAVVEGKEDAEDGLHHPWMIDNSKLVPLLLAEVQSLRRRLAAQEKRTIQ
jgi:hypothetical protein